jgi:hypothetical protein
MLRMLKLLTQYHWKLQLCLGFWSSLQAIPLEAITLPWVMKLFTSNTTGSYQLCHEVLELLGAISLEPATLPWVITLFSPIPLEAITLPSGYWSS